MAQAVRVVRRGGDSPDPVEGVLAKAASGGPPIVHVRADPDTRALVKALVQGGPAPVRHDMAEASRRYAYTQNGILEDQTRRLTDPTLRFLAEEAAILQAIILTKLNMLLAHFRRPFGDRGIGWRVRQKDSNKALSPKAARRAREIEDVVRRGGVVSTHKKTGEEAVWDGNGQRRALPLESALRTLVRDSLTLDRAFVSIEGSAERGGKRENPVMFWRPEDAALMRFADREVYRPRLRPELNGRVEYVMLDPMLPWTVQREYAWGEGAMLIRNPRSEMGTMGYGVSEVQLSIEPVLGLRYAATTNRNWFTDNHVPSGILILPWGYGQDEMDELRTDIRSQVSPDNPYGVPMISVPDGSQAPAWIPLVDRTRLDMNFRAYCEWNVAEIASVHQIAAEELGFTSFGRSGAVLSEADPESLIQQSQHKWLLPLVLAVNDFLSVNLVERMDPEFEGHVQGLEERYDPEMLRREELRAARLQAGFSLNQTMDLEDEPRVYDPLDAELWRSIERDHRDRPYETERQRLDAMTQAYEGRGGRAGSYPDVPGNPILFQVWQLEHQQEKQQAQEDMRGAALGEIQGQRQEEQQRRQEARGALGSAAEQYRGHELGQEAAEAEAGRSGEMRVPGVSDALLRKGLPPKVIVRVVRAAEAEEETEDA